MIDYFEITKSDRSTCQRCKNFITDKKRGVEEVSGYGHKEYRYFCIKCSGEIIKNAKKELQNLTQTLGRSAKKLFGKVELENEV